MRNIVIILFLCSLFGISLSGQELKDKTIKKKLELFKRVDKLYQEDEGISIGDVLPPFNLKDINGDLFYSSEIMYQPAVIIYWSISSQHCLDLLPGLNQLKASLPSGVPLITIAMEEKDVIQNHLENNDYQFRILVNGRWEFRNNGWKRLPKTIIVTKENEIIDIFTSTTNGKPKAIENYHQRVMTIVNSLIK